MTPYVIAEAGSCHDGFLTKAEDMVRMAAAAGADACKFQWVSSVERLAQRRNAQKYARHYRLIAFDPRWHDRLARKCADVGIDYMCTVYLPEDIPMVAPYVSMFKVASFEAGDEAFIKAHTGRGKTVLVSTGMLEEEETIRFMGSEEVYALHCVSSYPAPLEAMNLAVLRNHGFAGLSDHSHHLWTGALAVAAGARYLEVHFRHPTTAMRNPDFPHAWTLRQLKMYINNARLAATMMGDGVKVMQEAEREMAQYRVKS